jgi:hypothetical protein
MEKKISFFGVLKDHVDGFVLADRIPKSNTMRMSQLWMNSYLSFNELQFWLWGNIGQIDLNFQMLLTIFIAYCLPVDLWTASFTTPNDPLPSFLSSILNYFMDLNIPFEIIFMSL